MATPTGSCATSATLPPTKSRASASLSYEPRWRATLARGLAIDVNKCILYRRLSFSVGVRASRGGSVMFAYHRRTSVVRIGEIRAERPLRALVHATRSDTQNATRFFT